jgi:DMSO/TMAO reductase YedYZ molybdopterin-dependent catalytic subunit
MKKPPVWYGALAGALLMASLIAVSYLGWIAAGLPFAPFDLFDWAVRALPGSVVTFGVDSMVALGRALNASNIGAAAKTGDQAAAIGGLFLLGIAGGAAFVALLRVSDEPALLLGAIVGAMLGGVVLVIEQQVNRIAAGPFGSGPWLFITFFAWGVAIGWVYDRLRETGDADRGLAPDGGASRRRFLIQLGGTTLTTTFAATTLGAIVGSRSDSDSLIGGRWSDTHPLPNANAAIAPVSGTRPEFTPLDRHYRIDTNTRAPEIDGARWRLKVDGLMQRPLTLTLNDLRQYDPMHQFITLSCISNPIAGDLISTTRWTGVSLKRLLPELIMSDAATHLRITSADGFSESVAIDAIRNDERIMLAYAWDGVPLPAEHGFPLRLYIPDLYGMKQPKWIAAIDVTDRWEAGYWVARGWDRDGRVTITSAVDVVTTGAMAEIGGIAFAGSRGVSKVEVRVDEGEWHAAQLRDPLSETTWVLWRARVELPRGDHVFTVRAFDGQGRPQAAGFHTRRVQL